MNKYQKRRNKVIRYKVLDKKKIDEIIYDDKKYNEFLKEEKEINKLAMENLKEIMPQWFHSWKVR